MATPTPRYEFTDEQNQMIGSLAGKMKFVGFFAILAGVINLIMAILLVAAIYQDRIPEEWKTKTSEYLQQVRDKLPDSVRQQAEQYSLDRLPPSPKRNTANDPEQEMNRPVSPGTPIHNARIWTCCVLRLLDLTRTHSGGSRAGTRRLRLLSVTGFPVSPRPRLAEFTVPD